MKRIAIGAFVFMLAAVLLVGCGISEQEKKERAEQKELYGQYVAILDSGKTYEELSDTEKRTIDPILKNGLLKDEERYLKKNLENYEEKLSKMKDSKIISDQKNRPAPTAVQTTPVMISNAEKENISKEIKGMLSDENVTSVAILTDSATGEPIASIQVQGSNTKGEMSEDQLAAYCEDIQSRISSVVSLCNIELIDANYQLEVIYDSNTGVQFF